MDRSPKRSRAGFTIVEMMVAGTVLAIITSFLLSSLSIQKRNYTINDQIVEIQQGARIIGDVLERDLRHAGFMAPPSGGFCLVDNTNAPDILLLSDEGAVQTAGETNADLAARVTSGQDNVPDAPATLTLQVDDLILEVVNPTPSYDTDGDGANDSDFRVGSGVIVVDRANPERGAACATVRSIPAGGNSIQIDMLSDALAAAMPNPADLSLVPARIYQVNAQNQLLRNGAVVASDVEDLQIAVFVDLDEDGDIDANEYLGAAGNPLLEPQKFNLSLAREARAGFVLRTRDPDPNFTQGTFQTLENRAPVAGADGFRRRAWVSTIMFRNIAPRPS
jgi:type II secretory pathway pseudopilin PulG